MQFMVTGRDASDDGALHRRMAARDAHIATCDSLFEDGRLLVGFVLVDDNDKMIGSSLVFNVDSRQALDELLAEEPYVTQNVWESVEVQPCRLGPTFSGLFPRV